MDVHSMVGSWVYHFCFAVRRDRVYAANTVNLGEGHSEEF